MVTQQKIVEILDSFVDADYYNEIYPDVAVSKITPLEHFVKFGWKEGRKPNRWYSDSLVNSDLIISNPSTPPYVLFLSTTSVKEIESYKNNEKPYPHLDKGHTGCWSCNIMRGDFDPQYYRAKYADLPEGIDVLAHFCEVGWLEKRDPSPTFNTEYYLQANQDVAKVNINPFVHYLNVGHKEGRKPQPDDIVKKRLLQSLKTIRSVSADYAKIVPAIKVSSKEILFVKLFQGSAKATTGITMTFSHDNYLSHTGGIQKFILSESNWARQEGRLYVHFCPTIPDIDLVRHGMPSSFLVNCTISNEFIGTFTIAEIDEVLTQLEEKKSAPYAETVIHSMMGWNLELLSNLIINRFKKTIFYAHDYFALCTEYRLLRNGLHVCDAPPINSGHCQVCVHKSARVAHLPAVQKFFSQINPLIIFPSNCAKKVFSGSNLYNKLRSTVIPHIQTNQTKINTEKKITKDFLSKKKKIKIAFCGAVSGHKGFFHFEKIVDMCKGRNEVEFIHLGSSPSGVIGLSFKEVKLQEGKSVMSQVIRDEDIDVIFLGSIWRETFNFVTYEAAEAGVAIIALKDAGNVVDLVKNNNIGAVVDDWQRTVDLILSRDFAAQVATWKQSIKSLRFSENKSIFSLVNEHE